MLKNNKIIIMGLGLIGMAFGVDDAAGAVDQVAVAAAGSWTKGLAGIGAGLAVIGAGIGIGKIFGSAAEATARQPEAANEIRSTVNLPLFLLEGVGIIALVVCLLAVVL
tara:strand:- start:34 stop:360 length:327 start_codon:yes stop_codon:yes gene_type:complete